MKSRSNIIGKHAAILALALSTTLTAGAFSIQAAEMSSEESKAESLTEYDFGDVLDTLASRLDEMAAGNSLSSETESADGELILDDDSSADVLSVDAEESGKIGDPDASSPDGELITDSQNTEESDLEDDNEAGIEDADTEETTLEESEVDVLSMISDTVGDVLESAGLLSAGEEGSFWSEANRLSKREQIVEYALQFVGNPYVWGGTSLTNGADCSGFVLSVLSEFGYSLPRVAVDQYNASTKKDLSALEPGDLVFYGGGITHVAMYIGDGQIVHAANSRLGIIVSDITWMNPVGAGTYLE